VFSCNHWHFAFVSWSRNFARPSRAESLLSFSRGEHELSFRSVDSINLELYDSHLGFYRNCKLSTGAGSIRYREASSSIAREECRRTWKTRKRRLTADLRPFTVLERIPTTKHRYRIIDALLTQHQELPMICIEGDFLLFIARDRPSSEKISRRKNDACT